MRSPLFLMGLTVFIDITGFGLVLPLLPFWAQRLGADAFVIGLITTAYALAQFLFTPLLGALSDRYGRRPVILVSLLVEAAAFAMTALAGTLPMLLVARFVGGMGASNIGSAQAVVADVTPPEQRARGMGVIGAAIGLGFVVGPALGGLLATLGAATPFWVAMGVALLNALLVWRFLPETRVAHRSVVTAQRRAGLRRLAAGVERAGGGATHPHQPAFHPRLHRDGSRLRALHPADLRLERDAERLRLRLRRCYHRGDAGRSRGPAGQALG